MTPDLVAEYVFAVGGPLVALYAAYRLVRTMTD